MISRPGSKCRVALFLSSRAYSSGEEGRLLDIIICGAEGKLGGALRCAIAARRDCRLVAGVDPRPGGGAYPWYGELGAAPAADVIIDASFHTALPDIAGEALRRGSALVVAATGHTREERAALSHAAAGIPVFVSANYSLGAALLCEFARRAAAVFPGGEMEIVEAHHSGKRDAPSGTALALFEAIREVRPRARAHPGRVGGAVRRPEEVGIHSLRLGSLPGTHSVCIATGEETLTLTHTAMTPAVFAVGILRAAAYVLGRAPGVYTMSDLLYM